MTQCPDLYFEAPLSEIEGIARELLRGYEGLPNAGDWSSGQDHPLGRRQGSLIGRDLRIGTT